MKTFFLGCLLILSAVIISSNSVNFAMTWKINKITYIQYISYGLVAIGIILILVSSLVQYANKIKGKL